MLCDNSAVVQEYKRGAADYILAKYSWDDVVEKTVLLYEQIAGWKKESTDSSH